jgi:hypothetical protein
MITAHSDDVKLPPGRYQVSTVLKCQVNHSKRAKGTSGKKQYKRVRPSQKTRSELEAERYLLDAAIDDPDELQELWSR